MRKRIRQIARDKFEYDQPCISLPEEELSIQVLEGQTYEGSFSVASTNRIPVRGIVYTTNPRMECLTTQFEGEEIRIRYQFHSKGLVEGEVEKGDFVLVCEESVHPFFSCIRFQVVYRSNEWIYSQSFRFFKSGADKLE